MYKRFALLIIIAIAVSAPATAATPTVQDIVNLISQTSFQSYLDTTLPTHIHDNRGFDLYGNTGNVNIHGAQHDPAAESIFVAFRRSGWLTYFDPFSYRDDSGKTWSGRNIIAVKQGTTNPDNIYIVSSHYDSIANHESSWTYAPGGDDNGSGTAGLMEMARVMAPYKFGATIIFCAFDGEEYGITVNGASVPRLGSMHYATSHANDNMLGMVSFDMISWSDGSNTGRLETGFSQNAGINAQMTSALQTYGGLGVYTNNSSNYSDHVSFAKLPRQVPALMLIENNWPNNPNYHRQTDSVDTANYINYAYGTKMLKSVCGWVCTQAVVTGGP